MITIQCCICGAILGTKDGQGKDGISHTVCPDCLPGYLAQNGLDPKLADKITKGGANVNI
jgi:hypothetical protein